MKIALAISALLSLCGISYQFLLVRALDPFLQDEVLCQSISLGVFLLSMGLGAAFSAKKSGEKALMQLYKIEILLSLLGALLIPIVYSMMTGIELLSETHFFSAFLAQEKIWKLALFQPLVFIIGALTGCELPLLSAWLEKRGHRHALTKILAFSYFGALGGSFFVSFFLVPRLGLIPGTIVVSFLNLLAAVAILFLDGMKLRALLKVSLAVLLISTTQLGVLRLRDPIEQTMLKTLYLELRFPMISWLSVKAWWNALDGFAPITRYHSSYQNIDLVPSRFFLPDPNHDQFALYLNHQPQFTKNSLRAYHESMVVGAMALSGKKVKNALVLGGGDGLVAAELLRRGVERITLVELDPFVIELARSHQTLSSLNRNALEDPRVSVLVKDAFSFVREEGEKFDAAFVDFPFPSNYDLLKLYSVEFYQALSSRLVEDAFFVFDAPIWTDKRILEMATRPYPHEIFYQTLLASGFKSPFAFGPMEPFVFVSKTNEPAKFDYTKIPPTLSGKTYFNLTSIDWPFANLEPDPKLANSVFRPRRMRW
jgi:spermidine synthase